jgi:predicted transcriptional regulator
MTKATVPRPAKHKKARNKNALTEVAKGRRRASVVPPAANEEVLVATTLRLEPAIRRGLELLQDALGTTLNRLMNEALAIYVAQRTAALQRDVEASLDRIKRYRKTDQTFSKVFAAIAEEEAVHGHNDPAEGVPLLEKPGVHSGTAVAAVRQLIRGHK